MLFRSMLRAAFLGCILALPASVSAQNFSFSTGPMMPGMGKGAPNKIFMVQRAAVQKDLEMTAEQIKKVKDLLGELGQLRQPEGEGKEGEAKIAISFTVLTPPVGSNGEVMPPAMPDFAGMEKELEKILNDKQKARLKQIGLQETGLMAMAQEEVAKELELNSDQKNMVKEAVESQQKEMMKLTEEMFKNGGFGNIQIGKNDGDKKTGGKIITNTKDGVGGMKFVEKMRDMKKKTEDELALLLSPDQKTKWEEMQGPKFVGAIKR